MGNIAVSAISAGDLLISGWTLTLNPMDKGLMYVSDKDSTMAFHSPDSLSMPMNFPVTGETQILVVKHSSQQVRPSLGCYDMHRDTKIELNYVF